MSDPDVPDAAMDPVMEKLRRKMVRLLAISIAVLFVGLIAVLSAVVYRTGGAGEDGAVAEGAPAGAPLYATVAVPAGARVVGVTPLERDRALLLVETGEGAQLLLLLDVATGAVVSRVELRAAP